MHSHASEWHNSHVLSTLFFQAISSADLPGYLPDDPDNNPQRPVVGPMSARVEGPSAPPFAIVQFLAKYRTCPERKPSSERTTHSWRPTTTANENNATHMSQSKRQETLNWSAEFATVTSFEVMCPFDSMSICPILMLSSISSFAHDIFNVPHWLASNVGVRKKHCIPHSVLHGRRNRITEVREDVATTFQDVYYRFILIEGQSVEQTALLERRPGESSSINSSIRLTSWVRDVKHVVHTSLALRIAVMFSSVTETTRNTKLRTIFECSWTPKIHCSQHFSRISRHWIRKLKRNTFMDSLRSKTSSVSQLRSVEWISSCVISWRRIQKGIPFPNCEASDRGEEILECWSLNQARTSLPRQERKQKSAIDGASTRHQECDDVHRRSPSYGYVKSCFERTHQGYWSREYGHHHDKLLRRLVSRRSVCGLLKDFLSLSVQRRKEVHHRPEWLTHMNRSQTPDGRSRRSQVHGYGAGRKVRRRRDFRITWRATHMELWTGWISVKMFFNTMRLILDVNGDNLSFEEGKRDSDSGVETTCCMIEEIRNFNRHREDADVDRRSLDNDCHQ